MSLKCIKIKIKLKVVVGDKKNKTEKDWKEWREKVAHALINIWKTFGEWSRVVNATQTADYSSQSIKLCP